MATWCSGWNDWSNSFGRTSKPQVSVATAAISVRCSQVLLRDREPVRQLLDAGHLVTVGGDGLRRVPPVPRLAVVEDVAEPVPLGRALQRHRDHVVRPADPVREPLVPEGGVGPGVEHGVHRVGPPPPAALRSVGVEPL
jgi:hypothetical protein